MDRRNYFEMLGLEFDPPEKNERKIEQAIAAWKKQTEDLLGGATDPARRAVLTAELALHDSMAAAMKDKAARQTEAREMKEQRVAQLEKLIDIMLMGQTGTPEVTGAQIRNVGQKLKLQQKTVESAYVKKGFTVQKQQAAVKLTDAFLTTVIAGEISKKTLQLRSMQTQKFPWTGKVNDLFDLACYFSGGTEMDAAGFRKKKTTELYSIMKAGAIQVASDMSDLGRVLADLFTAGTSQVFDTEENRKKYMQTLEREKLKDFFDLLKAAPEDFKKDRFFAESCIKTIQRRFPDFDLSLALYNQEAGLVKDPYEPVEALIHVTCSVCKTPLEFRTREEAEKARCTACGAELYVSCPRCRKRLPASAEWCGCGFHISEMQFFDEYYSAAEFALKEMDLAEARRQLLNAKNANPGSPRLAALEKQIQAETDKYQKPLNDLQALMNDGRYFEAQAKLARILFAAPQLRLEEQKKRIDGRLAEAKRMMPAAGLPQTERANRCAEILAIVKDYGPALDILERCRPGAVKNLQAAVAPGEPLTCTLTWSAAGDKGVAYCVVRKKGGVPRQYSDGEMLAQELQGYEYRDRTMQPGIGYGYAVFAKRAGVYSDPATCEAEYFSELDEKQLRFSADDCACRFSWVLPPNCVGVRLLRCRNGTPPAKPIAGTTVVAERAFANFEDGDVANNATYGYRLQCVYPYGSGFRYSEGRTVMLTPEQPPVALQKVTARTEGRTVELRWTAPDAKKRTVLVREVTSPSARKMVGQLLPATDINQMLGRTYANSTSIALQCRFDIPADTALQLAVVIISGTKGIISEIVQAASVPKCEISREQTRIEGSRLKLVLQKLPENLERIHYIAARKTGSRVPWAEKEDAKRGSLSVMTREDYVKDGMLVVENLPQEELYISVIGEYRMPGGSTVYSEVSKLKLSNKPKEQIQYSLTWGGGLFSIRAKQCVLRVRCSAGETPELKLVYRQDGHIPLRLRDPQNVVLHTVPETESGYPSGRYEYTFPDSTWDNIDTGTELRLMLQEEDAPEYELTCDTIHLMKVPKK